MMTDEMLTLKDREQEQAELTDHDDSLTCNVTPSML